MISSKRAYRIHEAVNVVSLSRSMIYKLIQTGQLRVVKVGNCTLILAEELERFLKEGHANDR